MAKRSRFRRTIRRCDVLLVRSPRRQTVSRDLCDAGSDRRAEKGSVGAQLDADGNPVKDTNGRFIKTDLVGYAVMEKRTGWGAEYPEEKRNGEWEYQVFTADRKVNDKANLNSCFECHKPHVNTDFLFTADKIKAASK